MVFAAQWAASYTAMAQWAVPGNKPGTSEVHLTTPSASIGEQQDAPFLARVYTKASALVKQADVYQILVRVWDSSGTEVYGVELDPTDAQQGTAVIVDTIDDTAAKWDADGTGFNFSYTIPGRGVFLAGGGNYTVEFVLEMTDGDNLMISGTLKVRPTRTFKQTQTQ